MRLIEVIVIAGEKWYGWDTSPVDADDLADGLIDAEVDGESDDWPGHEAGVAPEIARYWNAFSAAYYDAPLDEQLAMGRRAIAEGPSLDSAYAAEIVTGLARDLRAAGRIDDIEDLLARVAARSPDLARESRFYRPYCHVMNAITRAEVDNDLRDADIESHLLSLAHLIGELDKFFLWAITALMYHGHTRHIVDACRIAWPQMQATVDDLQVTSYTLWRCATAVALDDFLAANEAWDEAAFLAHIAPFHAPALPSWWSDMVAQRNPASRRALTRADLLSDRVSDTSVRAVRLLVFQFADTLHTRWAWPRSRAELVRQALAELLVALIPDPDVEQRKRPAHGRHKGRKQGRHRRKARGHAPRHLHAVRLPWFAGTAAAVEDFVVEELTVADPGRQHHAAALVQAIPLWWQILAEHDVLDEPALRRLQKGTGRLAGLAVMFDEESDDPALARDIAHAYDTVPAFPGFEQPHVE